MAVLAGPACNSVTAENLQTWKGTEKGPAKIEDALKNSSVAPELRAQAAMALVDIQLAETVDATLAALPEADRAVVVKALVPVAAGALHDPIPGKAADARDLLMSVRSLAADSERAAIDKDVLAQVEQELTAGRAISGRFSLVKIVNALGAAAGPALARALGDPKANVSEIAPALAQVGDEAAREQGGQALLKRAREKSPIPASLWRALGSVSGKSAQAFLLGKVHAGSGPDAVLAAQALQQRRDPALLPVALRLAGDPSTPKGVREEMFGLVELVGGDTARDGLVAIIARDKDPLVRYRAYEAALVAGRADAIRPALEAFPAGASYLPEDVTDYLVKDIEKLGGAAHEAVVQTVASGSTLARLTAVLALGSPKVGRAADADSVRKLSGDKAAVKGFPRGRSVGQEAARVADVLTQRAR